MIKDSVSEFRKEFLYLYGLAFNGAVPIKAKRIIRESLWDRWNTATKFIPADRFGISWATIDKIREHIDPSYVCKTLNTADILEIIRPYLNSFQKKYYEENKADGWHEGRQDGTALCLVHSEISEAMEGIRRNLMDDHLPNRPMAEVELADAIFRILDFAGHKGYDVAGAMIEKYRYNKNRPDHKPENRNKEHGKKF